MQSVSMQGADQSERFSGTWQAKVKDSVVCTFVIRAGGKVAGAMESCKIHTDPDGNLVELKSSDDDEVSKPTPISNARVAEGVLAFDCADGDEEALRFEMTIVRDGVADLVLKNAPVKVKPIRFVRLPPAE